MPDCRIDLSQFSFTKDQIHLAVIDVVPTQTKYLGQEPYRAYCTEELRLLQSGIAQEGWQLRRLAARNDEEVKRIVRFLKNNLQSTKVQVRRELKQWFPSADDLAVDRAINLSLRLWLMINFQELEFRTLRHSAECVSWGDSETLDECVSKLFPPSRWETSAAMNRLGPYFTAVFMKEVCGLKIEWTTSLSDHLLLDRKLKTVRVFAFKGHLAWMLSEHVQKVHLPMNVNVLKEAVATLNLLFPIWDHRTIQYLEREGQTFQNFGPYDAHVRSLALTDFNYFRDRLMELREVLEAPPNSLAQLWLDRRHPQQFWTFWIALLILFLTILSLIASVIQAWASVKSLQLTMQATAPNNS